MLQQPAQNVTAPTDADRERLRAQRTVVEKYLADDASRQKYQTAPGKLGTVRAILHANFFSQVRPMSCSAWVSCSATHSSRS